MGIPEVFLLFNTSAQRALLNEIALAQNSNNDSEALAMDNIDCGVTSAR